MGVRLGRIGDGDGVGVLLPVGVGVVVSKLVPDDDDVIELVIVPEEVPVGVTDRVGGGAPVDDGEAPTVRDAVGVRVCERVEDVLDEGVSVDVGVPELVCDEVELGVLVADAVGVSVGGGMPDDDGDAPSVIDGVGDDV